MKATTSTITHDSLGNITGVFSGTVGTFRGLKYGTLASRFAAGELNTAPPPDGDATVYGPEPLQNPEGCDIEWFLIGKECTREPGVSQSWSGTDCLCLNVTVPAANPPSQKLPVLVFIHGGNYLHGAPSWPQYSVTALVDASITASTPIIAVSLNYRTNVFGFLHAPDLPTNRGLTDQLLALSWIRKHISGFGGDPENITLLGQSAGSAAVGTHIAAGLPGVKRAIMMSGTPGLRPAVPATAFTTLTEKLPVTTLETIPQGDLYSALPEMQYLPSLPLPSGTGAPLEALMIGDTRDDGGILISQTPPSAHLFPAEVAALYDLNDPAALRDILTDWVFRIPAMAAAQAAGCVAYRYHFNLKNPWDGPWKGQANHILDLATLLGKYPELEEGGVGREMREAVVRFVNGKAPWGEEIRVFGSGSGGQELRDREQELWGAAERAGGWEKVRDAVMAVLEKS